MTESTIDLSTLSEPPSVPGLPILGNLLPFATTKGFPIDFLVDSAQDYGSLVTIKIANVTMYLVSEPALIREVFIKRYQEFHKPDVLQDEPRGLRRFLGDGILTSDHDKWRPQRKLIQPLMHTKYLNNYADAMSRFGEQLLASWEDGAERNIHEDMVQVTMWIIAETMFGTDVENFQQVYNLGNRVQEITISDLSSRRPEWMSRNKMAEVAEINETLTNLVKHFMADRAEDEEERSDLLTLLLNARYEDGNPVSEQFVRDNVLTLFVAGHETTANTLTWAFYYLHQNPDVRAKLQQEVDTVLQGRAPTLEDLPNLPYTLQVIKETMRIEPTVSAIPRVVTEDTELGGYRLKGKSMVFVSPYIMHHDERFWDDPYRFDPDRFRAENEANIPKYVYFPFGMGPRICIGNHFSLMESQILLALIASRYDLLLMPDAEVKPRRYITTEPENGMPMQVHKRV